MIEIRSRCYLRLICVLCVVIAMSHTSDDPFASIDEAYLFDKSQRIDRITIKNQIAYHFQQKVVKEVTQELFVSRLIHVQPLVDGLEILNRTASYLESYCKNRDAPVKPISTSYPITTKQGGFICIKAGDYTYREAKAKCEGLDMQLPEMYYGPQSLDFAQFMKKVGMVLAFAGIELDRDDVLFKFVSTGMPIWNGWYPWANNTERPGTSYFLGDLASRQRVYFMYFHNGGLRYYIDKTAPANFVQYKDFWKNHKGHYEAYKIQGVICQPKWKGHGMEELYTDTTRNTAANMSIKAIFSHSNQKRHTGENENTPVDKLTMNITKVIKREVPEDGVSRGNEPPLPTIELGSKELSNTCYSIASQISELHTDLLRKMENLLALVDIKMVLEQPDNAEVSRGNQPRKKRLSSLVSKILFKKGTKVLWSLFGFYQQIQTDRKIKQNRKDIDSLKTNVDGLQKSDKANKAAISDNRKQIMEATSVLKDHSIVITELVIAADDLKRKVDDMDNKVDELQHEVDVLRDEVDTITTLTYIESLATRVSMAVDSGYEQLADIVHTSLVGQTSPLILPLAQMREVQMKLKDKSISATLDKDFSKMKSVVTADPNNPGLLLVVINAIAVSHLNLELVHLIPVPYYDKERAYLPILDYQYVALNQPHNTFTVLSYEEAEACVTGRCYISQMEQSLFSQSCGMPQFQDHQLESCDTDTVLHDGMYIQSANPDGIIFSFRENVTIQLFCKENTYISEPREISGAGTMYVPSGCTLTARDNKKGSIIRIKGGPTHHLIEVQDLELAKDSIIGATLNRPKGDQKPRKPSAETAIEKQFSVVQESMNNTHRDVSNLQRNLWITAGCILLIIMFVVIGVLLLYRYSRRFKYRFKKIVGTLSELKDKLTDIDMLKAKLLTVTPRISRWPRPVAPPRLNMEDHHYLHLRAQADANTREPREKRVYARLPISPTVDALTSPDLRLPASERFQHSTVRPRIYPEVPPKNEYSSGEEMEEQSRELEELSVAAETLKRHHGYKRSDNE